jgi:hypothetical protein
MELNGVANLKILIDEIGEIEAYENQDRMTVLVDKAREQLVLLERYMLAFQDHTSSIQAGAYGAKIVGVEEPLWHEVRENPDQYPTARERIEGFKKQMEQENG